MNSKEEKMDIFLGYTETNLEQLSVHHVGNRENDDELNLSKSGIDVTDTMVQELMSKYFLEPFQGIEFYSFIEQDIDGNHNRIMDLATEIFETDVDFHGRSVKIAEELYDAGSHPDIKDGDLFVAHFSGIHIGDELTDVVGIFKAETKTPFMKLKRNDENEFSINFDDGINMVKLDKGCLIFNVAKEDGYRLCILNKVNRAVDTQYWKDIFLGVGICSDSYNSTKEFLNITKNFITKQVPEEFQVSRTDKIDLLNRSIDYFRGNDEFSKNDFESKVLQDEGMIESFRNYDCTYQNDHVLELDDHFGISDEAVKKQSRIFKSVIKLDKNFHIYVHGNKNLIEQGMDGDGRKFYKIYFDTEQ